MHAAGRIGWRMNRTNHNDADLSAAQEAYKTGFEEALEKIGPVNLPRAVSPIGGSRAPQYPADYKCSITDGENMDGCCGGKDNDMTWDQADATGCHRVDIIVEQKCVGADKKAATKACRNCGTGTDQVVAINDTCPRTCSTESILNPAATCTDKYAGELFKFGDVNAICYMCLCECQNVIGSDDYDSTQPACFDIEDGERDEYCKDYKSYRAKQKMQKTLGALIVVGVNMIIKK